MNNLSPMIQTILESFNGPQEAQAELIQARASNYQLRRQIRALTRENEELKKKLHPQ